LSSCNRAADDIAGLSQDSTASTSSRRQSWRKTRLPRYERWRNVARVNVSAIGRQRCAFAVHSTWFSGISVPGQSLSASNLKRKCTPADILAIEKPK
jgi:hypothetical protein